MNVKQLGKNEREIYEEARRMVAAGAGAVEFSARFFGPQGRVRELWKTEAARRKVVGEPLFRWLQERLAEIRGREAQAFDQEVEALSGRLTVMVPKSLHAALKREALLEGVSLSELIRLKLGASYRSIAQLVAGGGGGQGPRAGSAR